MVCRPNGCTLCTNAVAHMVFIWPAVPWSITSYLFTPLFLFPFTMPASPFSDSSPPLLSLPISPYNNSYTCPISKTNNLYSFIISAVIQNYNHKKKTNQIFASAPAYHALSLWLEGSQHNNNRIVSWWSFDISSKLVAVKPYHWPLRTPVHQLLDLFIKHHLQSGDTTTMTQYIKN